MKLKNNKVITRFPPSPTGALHIGNVRTALFNYLYAKQNGGEFIVRVEDTDKARSKKEYEESMLEGLEWLSIEREGDLQHQSERGEVYKKYLDKLIEDGEAYVSEESEGENREVVRFKNPNKIVEFEDLVRGKVSFDTAELKDFIIARNVDEPIYHLAVVVDDFESGVTHVIRGEDHISNTPRQILIQEAIGAPRPVYAHLPLILAPDRSKLSKRKHGETVSLDYYRNKGYLPQAVVNYLALLGWNPGTEQEIFTIEELINVFDLSQVQKGGAIFDEKKLDWVNKEHIKLLPEKEQQAIREREVVEEPYIKNEPVLDKSKINWKNISDEETIKHLKKAVEIIKDEKDLMTYATEVGKGSVLWPVRYALSGEERSPDPFTLISVLGKEKSIERLKKAITILEK
ncbi:MAG: glutamate--tRNA ligase family protein [Parcubacteria group bacterium]